MEKRDLELIERYSPTDKTLASLYKQHLDYERQIEKLENKLYLTTDEQVERARLKKMKLKGRDEMEKILKKYRDAHRRGAFES